MFAMIHESALQNASELFKLRLKHRLIGARGAAGATACHFIVDGSSSKSRRIEL
jgi:hypothetical protein